jgi:hypothetical protein
MLLRHEGFPTPLLGRELLFSGVKPFIAASRSGPPVPHGCTSREELLDLLQ